MKFSDIDFSALSNMMNSMSKEEKEKLNDMAENVMNSMQKNNEETEENEDFYSFLHIKEEEYQNLPGIVLDQMEAAGDLEQYYEDIEDADFSGSILFYAKAILNLLRENHFDVYKKVLDLKNLKDKTMTTLYDFYVPLMNEDNLHILMDAGYGASEDWIAHRNLIQQMYIMLNRAQFDTIHYNELQLMKEKLLDENGILRIVTMLKK